MRFMLFGFSSSSKIPRSERTCLISQSFHFLSHLSHFGLFFHPDFRAVGRGFVKVWKWYPYGKCPSLLSTSTYALLAICLFAQFTRSVPFSFLITSSRASSTWMRPILRTPLVHAVWNLRTPSMSRSSPTSCISAGVSRHVSLFESRWSEIAEILIFLVA